MSLASVISIVHGIVLIDSCRSVDFDQMLMHCDNRKEFCLWSISVICMF